MTFCKTVSKDLYAEIVTLDETYASHPYSVLIEGAPFHYIGLQAIVDLRHKLESESLHKSLSAECKYVKRKESCTFKIVVAGMQCVSKSYNFARTCSIRAGVRSSTISFAMTSIRASQSGGGIGVFSVTLSLPPS